MSRRKYKVGKKITSLDELIKQEFVYIYSKIYHQGWWKSYQFNYIIGCLARGVIYKAKPQKWWAKELREREKDCKRLQILEEELKQMSKKNEKDYLKFIKNYEEVKSKKLRLEDKLYPKKISELPF